MDNSSAISVFSCAFLGLGGSPAVLCNIHRLYSSRMEQLIHGGKITLHAPQKAQTGP